MTPPVPRIDVSSLGLGPELGSGGQGKVTAVSGLLVGGQWPAVLKAYSPDAARDLDAAALEAIVGFPRQLGAADAGWLDENTAWPTMIAENRGHVCGFLMRAVPPDFHFDFQTRTMGAQRKLADVAFLLNPDSYLASSGLPVSERDRLGLLSSLAKALGRLHGMGVVVGDLSPKNLLFRLTPAPGCFLIDCDAAQVRGQTVLKQVETPDWEVPPGEPIATTAADAYKLALLAVRLFARDQSSRDPAALDAVSPELGRLAEASLHRGPHYRPGPREWIPALDTAGTTVSAARISVSIPPLNFEPAPPAPAPRPAAGPSARRGPAALLGVAAAIILVIVVIAIAIHSSAQPSSALTQGTSGGSAAQGSSGSGGQDSGSVQGSPAATAQSPLDQLTAIANQDQLTVQDLAEDSWIPILSSKQDGTVDPRDAEFPNQAYTDEMILQNFNYWHARYPSALLLQSQSYSSLIPGYWTIVLNQSYSAPGDVISWCKDQGLNDDDCDATLLSNQLPQGPQTYEGW